MAHHNSCNKGNMVGGRMMLDHDKRNDHDRTRANANIDAAKSHLNCDYSMKNLTAGEAWDWACEYAQGHCSKSMRKNAIVMSMDLIHLPKNWEEVYPGTPASEFFEKVALPFERQRYGYMDAENEISAVVHYDETKIDGHEGRPHLHYKYVPITKKGKCCHKEVNCLSDMKALHGDLVRFASDAGFPGLDLYNEERAQSREAAVSMPDYKKAMEIVADAQREAQEAQNKLTELQSELVQTSKAVEDKRAVLTALDAQIVNLEAKLEELKADVEAFVREYLRAPFARIKELIAEFGAESSRLD